VYDFVKDNFNSFDHFVRAASSSAYIEWLLNTGEVIAGEGLNFIPGLEKIQMDNESPDKPHIYQIIPKDIYVLIWKKADYFFSIQNRKLNKDYILAFTQNYFNDSTSSLIGLHANIQIINDSGIASLNITYTEALNNLKERILIIAELISINYNKIVGVVSLDIQSNILLKNYEFEILQLIAQGYLSDTISELLCISKHTVDDSRKDLLIKFKAKNIYQLIAHAYQEGFV
jgi:DNA-binding CsgD family transcriptional regulator